MQKSLALIAMDLYAADMPNNRLRELRIKQGLTGVQLAIEVGVDAATISRWENHKSSIPDSRKHQLALLFATSVSHLMGWDEQPRNDGHGKKSSVVA